MVASFHPFAALGMLRRQHHVFDSENRIRTRSKCLQFVDLVAAGVEHVEIDRGPVALADPVALHRLDPFRPVLELVQVGEQILGKSGDLDKPLVDLALLDLRPGTPAFSVDHLLIGQYGLIHRVPVDQGLFSVYQSLLEHLDKDPLVPAVIFFAVAVQKTRPVIAETERLHLGDHVVHTLIGPGARMDVVLDGGILGGQAEGIETHRIEDIAALHAAETGYYVADGIVADVPHVQFAGGIRVHLQHIVFLTGGIGGGLKHLVGAPVFLPLLLNLLDFVYRIRHLDALCVSREA